MAGQRPSSSLWRRVRRLMLLPAVVVGVGVACGPAVAAPQIVAPSRLEATGAGRHQVVDVAWHGFGAGSTKTVEWCRGAGDAPGFDPARECVQVASLPTAAADGSAEVVIPLGPAPADGSGAAAPDWGCYPSGSVVADPTVAARFRSDARTACWIRVREAGAPAVTQRVMLDTVVPASALQTPPFVRELAIEFGCAAGAVAVAAVAVAAVSRRRSRSAIV